MGERGSTPALEICSYRTVFELERRIYRVDRLRLNPQGVPVRGVVYALAFIAGSVLAGRLPAIAVLAHAFPWYVRDLGGPVLLAALAATIRIDGRPFHLAAMGLFRLAAGPRHLSALRPACGPGRVWAPGELVMLPDGSDPRVRRLRFAGPGAVIVALAHERSVRPRGSVARLLRRPDVVLRAPSTAAPRRRARVVEVAASATLETRPGQG